MKKLACVLLLAVTYSVNALPGDTCRMKIGMNLFSIGLFDSQQPFVDMMKTSWSWMAQDITGTLTSQNNTLPSPIPSDADGYPLSLPYTYTSMTQNQTVATMMGAGVGGNYPAGTYTVLYSGTGTFTFGLDAAVSSTTVNQIILNVTPSNNGIYMKILSSSSVDHVRNIRVLIPGSFQTYLSQPFNPVFTARITPFNTLRFMEWNNMNTNSEILWTNRRLTSYYTQSATGTLNTRGISHEYMIKLCNQLQKNCWVNIPTMADSTYIAEFAKLVRDSLDPSLKIYLEYSNECWNASLSIQNFNWIDSNSPAGLDHFQKTAYHSKQVFDIWKNVFGSTQMALRVTRVCAGWTSNQGKAQMDTMMHYLINNGSKPDAMSIGGYNMWTANDYTTVTSTCPNTINQVRNIDSLRWRSTVPVYTLFAQSANSYSIPITFYEGGTHIVGTSTGCASVTVMSYTSTIHMQNHYERILRDLRDTTGAVLFNAFVLSGAGLMGTLSNINFTTSTKYDALLNNIYNCPTFSGVNEEHLLVTGLLLYPDPNNGSFTIRVPKNINDPGKIHVYDLLGQKVQANIEMKEDGLLLIRMNENSAGIYFVQLISGDVNYSLKFIYANP